MLATLFAPLMALQATGEAPVAIKNDDPETWTVEYPLLIKPQVASYRRCLAVTDRRIAGKADFEAQHAGDVTRCTKARETAMAEANAALAGAKTTLSPEEVDQLFANIGHIHVARGRDLDTQFTARMVSSQAASDAYDANRPKGLVIELRDASVVKARTDAATAAGADTGANKDKDSQ
jgi:hypothetical protein